MPRNRKTPEQKADLAVLEMINVAQIRAGRPQTGEDLGKAAFGMTRRLDFDLKERKTKDDTERDRAENRRCKKGLH